MTTTTATVETTTAQTRRTPGWGYGLATAVVAAAATSIVAALIRAAGVDLTVDGEPIPILGFAQLVMISAVIGLVLARYVRRTTFLRVTITLTPLSCIPSLAWGTTAGDKVGLVCTHLVAAAIIIPRYARR